MWGGLPVINGKEEGGKVYGAYFSGLNFREINCAAFSQFLLGQYSGTLSCYDYINYFYNSCLTNFDVYKTGVNAFTKRFGSQQNTQEHLI